MINECRKSKTFIFIITLIMYILGFVVGYLFYQKVHISNPLLKAFIVNIIVTAVIYICSLVCKNPIVYKIYWGLFPMIIVPTFLFVANIPINVYTIIIVIIVEIWGAVTTIDCIYKLNYLKSSDWYIWSLKNKHPKVWPLINSIGLHLMPSVILFFAMLPIFSYLNAFNNNASLNSTLLICVLVSIISVIIKIVANIQIIWFHKKNIDETIVCKKGLWKNSRHPNYFGEIMYWFSMFLFSISVQDAMWILIFSPLIIFLMFVVIIIPRSERQQLVTKNNYEEYKKTTNMLLPIWPPITNENKKNSNHE